jgi:hypothetical protein
MQEFLDIGRREVPNDVDVVFGIFGDATRDAGQGLGDLTDVVRSEEHYRGEDLFGDLLNSGRDCPGAPRLGLLVPERYTGAVSVTSSWSLPATHGTLNDSVSVSSYHLFCPAYDSSSGTTVRTVRSSSTASAVSDALVKVASARYDPSYEMRNVMLRACYSTWIWVP